MSVWFGVVGLACAIAGVALNEYMGGSNRYAYLLFGISLGIALVDLLGSDR